MEQTLSFEELDLMFGDHAPFLMSLSDGSQEELRIVIATAVVGDRVIASRILRALMKLPNRLSKVFWQSHGQ